MDSKSISGKCSGVERLGDYCNDMTIYESSPFSRTRFLYYDLRLQDQDTTVNKGPKEAAISCI